jgi:hypothetical protein
MSELLSGYILAAAPMNDQNSNDIVNNSNTGCASTNLPQAEAPNSRQEIARHLPFLVRAWWLREYKEFENSHWQEDPYITGPLWSAYSDPMCDMAGLDYTYDLEK